MLHKSIELEDGEALDVLHEAEMSEEAWAACKFYLESNPSEARQMMEEETNPDRRRRKATLDGFADVWRRSMDEDPDEFARKIKALEEDDDLRALFDDMKAYRWDLVEEHLHDKELMMKVTRRMGGVPREAKARAERERRTPLTLQEACKFGDLRSLQRYLSETEARPGEREVDAQDHRGVTCLGYAIGANRMSITNLLIDSKADPAKVDNAGNSGLHYAAAYGRKDMVEYLLNLGADINAKNGSGMTPLAYATRNKQKATIQHLTDRGGA